MPDHYALAKQVASNAEAISKLVSLCETMSARIDILQDTVSIQKDVIEGLLIVPKANDLPEE